MRRRCGRPSSNTEPLSSVLQTFSKRATRRRSRLEHPLTCGTNAQSVPGWQPQGDQSRSGAFADAVDGPSVRNALQLVDAAWGKPDGRSGDERWYRGGDQDLVRVGECGDARADVDGQATDSPVH